MLGTPEDDPEFRGFGPKPRPERRFRWVRVILTTAGIVLLALALMLPAVRTASPAARRAQCTNNLKQIVLALRNYEDRYQALPPAFTTDAAGRPLHSWRTLILPYLEQESLYGQIDLAKPWNDPVNATAAATRLDVYVCPEAIDPKNTTVYLANAGPDGYLVPGHPRRVEEITDGLANTLAVIEAGDDDAVSWMAPVDADAALILKLDVSRANHHAGGANAALADGSVHFLKFSTPEAVRRALLSVAGHEAITADQF